MVREKKRKREEFLLFLFVPTLFSPFFCKLLRRMAGTTGLEPAASAVTGQRSNQLNYVPTRQTRNAFLTLAPIHSLQHGNGNRFGNSSLGFQPAGADRLSVNV